MVQPRNAQLPEIEQFPNVQRGPGIFMEAWMAEFEATAMQINVYSPF